jgi:hypothetical protein
MLFLEARGGFQFCEKPRRKTSTSACIQSFVRPLSLAGSPSSQSVPTSNINGVTEAEGKHLLSWFLKLVYENHDTQVRFTWQNENDIGTSGRIPRRPQAFADDVCKPSGTTAVCSIPPRLTILTRDRDLRIELLGSESSESSFTSIRTVPQMGRAGPGGLWAFLSIKGRYGLEYCCC